MQVPRPSIYPLKTLDTLKTGTLCPLFEATWRVLVGTSNSEFEADPLAS